MFESMISKIYRFLAIVCCCFFLAAVEKDLQLEPPIHHFGKIADSSTVSCFFTIHNHSKRTMQIAKIDTHCGCTKVKLPSRQIASGKKLRLQIIFDPRGRMGYVRWEILVFHNLSQEPLRANFTAEILKDDLLSQHAISFGLVRRGVPARQQVWLAPLASPHFTIKTAQLQKVTNRQYFTISWRRGTYSGFYPKARAGYCLEISVSKNIPFGRIDDALTIVTDIPGHTLIRLPIYARIIGAITTNRDYISMGILHPGKTVRKSILVYHAQEGKSFKILKAQTSIPFLKIEVKNIIAGEYYEVFISNKKTGQYRRGEFRGELAIVTDDAQQPQILLPIQGFIK